MREKKRKKRKTCLAQTYNVHIFFGSGITFFNSSRSVRPHLPASLVFWSCEQTKVVPTQGLRAWLIQKQTMTMDVNKR